MKTWGFVRTLLIFTSNVLIIGASLGRGEWSAWSWLALVCAPGLAYFLIDDVRASTKAGAAE